MPNHVGYIRETAHPKTGEVYYEGKVNLREFAGTIRLYPVERRNERAPAFKLRVVERGGEFDAGAAWRKEFKEPAVAKAFLTLTLDASWLRAPIYLTAFPNEEGEATADGKPDGEGPKKKAALPDLAEEMLIVWQRPRRQGAGPARAMDDHIRY